MWRDAGVVARCAIDFGSGLGVPHGSDGVILATAPHPTPRPKATSRRPRDSRRSQARGTVRGSMDKTASTLIAFAAGPANVERRAAAMLVLAELGLDDPKAVAAAESALASATVLQEYGLRYFEKLRPASGLAALVAQIDAADIGVRERVRQLVKEYGTPAVAAITAAARGERSKTWLIGAVEILTA